MTKFLVLYRSSVPAAEQMAAATPEQGAAGMEAWMAWAGKAGGAIVDLGAPLASAGVVPEAEEAEGAPAGAAHVSGFSILEADSAEDLRSLLDGHPHFHSPGESAIEILEFLPMPGG